MLLSKEKHDHDSGNIADVSWSIMIYAYCFIVYFIICSLMLFVDTILVKKGSRNGYV